MAHNHHDSLLNKISNTGSLEIEEIENIKRYFQLISVSRNTVLEEQEKIPKYLYFVVAGFMRLFYYDDNGEEQTTYLCSENGFIASFSALINQTKAIENVEYITDCEILKISYSDTKTLIEKSERFKEFSVTIFEQIGHLNYARANDMAQLTAEQRYMKMINLQPHFIQNIPLQYIASYLGIKPQSLSRIRKQINK
jgi:CRP/FNR family transcriptional regulator, anaerobic regulatory protein